MMTKRNTQIMLFYVMSAVALFALAGHGFAMDASPAATGLPGEGAMTKLVRFMAGPVAYLMIAAGLVAVCAGALGAMDLGNALKGGAAFVVVGGLMAFSLQNITILFTGATIPADGIPADVIVSAVAGVSK